MKTVFDATNYRQFIQLRLSEGQKKANYAALSRRAGFLSRSYPRDVVSGKRRITASSLSQFNEGLQLKGDLRAYFETLVAIDEPDAVPQLSRKTENSELKTRLIKIKSRLLRKKIEKKDATNLFRIYRKWLEIYAILGTIEKGRSLIEIARAVKTSEKTCKEVLHHMTTQGVAQYDETSDRYFPTQSHLVISDMGGSAFVKQYFSESLAQVNQWAQTAFDSQDRLFWNSVFSIDSKRATEFKNQLRDLIIRFVDQSESPDGDAVARVIIGFGTL